MFRGFLVLLLQVFLFSCASSLVPGFEKGKDKAVVSEPTDEEKAARTSYVWNEVGQSWDKETPAA